MPLTKIHFEDRPEPWPAAGGFVLWLLILSAMLFETDAYRYASVMVSFYGLYVCRHLDPRLTISKTAWLCLAWSVYVLVRFSYDYLASPIRDHGSSEWLYAFPIFFPTIGIGLMRMRFYFGAIRTVFFCAALVLLLFTQHWWVIASGEPVIPLFHENQIHGAVACGMIMIGAFYWFLYHAGRGFHGSLEGQIAKFVAPATIFLALCSILGSHSKGVWLALAGTLPVVTLWVLFSQRWRFARLAMGALVLLVVVGALFLRRKIWDVAGDTFSSTIALFSHIGTQGDLAAYMQQNIASGNNPESMNERLKIWYNAIELFRQAPVFGHGNYWIELWDHTRYADVGYYLMHNGYLEILIRHGLFGLVTLAVMQGCFFYLVHRGVRFGIIDPLARQAYVVLTIFFMLTLLSNSNNRLAIGESFAMMSGGFAFYCQGMERCRRLTGRLARVIPESVVHG